MMEDKIFNIKEFIERLNYYTQKYDEGKPEITDEQWDNMYFELKKLERTNHIVKSNEMCLFFINNKIYEIYKMIYSFFMLNTGLMNYNKI